jgi:hypothetical protein
VAAAALGTEAAASTVSIPPLLDPPLSHPKATVQAVSAKTKRFRFMGPRSSTRSGACAIQNPSRKTSLPAAAQGAGLGAFDHSPAALALDTKGVKARVFRQSDCSSLARASPIIGDARGHQG